MTPYRYRPPRTVRQGKLDNIALVPASLLPQKARYQALANGLPRGDVLMVLPSASLAGRKFLEQTAKLFEAKGRHVLILAVREVPSRGPLCQP